MRIQYVTNRVQRNVRDELGRHLIRRGLAKELKDEEKVGFDQSAEEPAMKDEQAEAEVPDADLKNKRKYKRRDMRAED